MVLGMGSFLTQVSDLRAVSQSELTPKPADFLFWHQKSGDRVYRRVVRIALQAATLDTAVAR